jgi:hypothetical protein
MNDRNIPRKPSTAHPLSAGAGSYYLRALTWSPSFGPSLNHTHKPTAIWRSIKRLVNRRQLLPPGRKGETRTCDVDLRRDPAPIHNRRTGPSKSVGKGSFDPLPLTLAKSVAEARVWCGRRDLNPHSHRETDFLTTSTFAAAAHQSWASFVVWTVPSPWPFSRRRHPSSLYTFPLARAWLGIGLGPEPVSVPRL